MGAPASLSLAHMDRAFSVPPCMPTMAPVCIQSGRAGIRPETGVRFNVRSGCITGEYPRHRY